MTAVPPTFLPWLRRGLAARITEAAVDGLAPHDTAHAAMSVTLRSIGGGGETVDAVPGPPVLLRGPADVVGLDPAQVLRRDPEPGTADAEPNYLVQVELAEPDLPWRYTPAAPTADRLQPWLALVVVAERTGVQLEERGPLLRPVLHVDEAATELPDLRQCWAWAHVQADHALTGGVAAALAAQPEAFRSRLLCPRRLTADRSWLACVVPTFEAGRRAGLGEPVVPDLGLAWTQLSTDVRLPVYLWWRFRTGPGGDFESLVRRLVPRELPGTVGRRDLDVGEPGGGLPSAPGTLLTYAGALVSPAGRDRPWPPKHRAAMTAAFRVMLGEQAPHPVAKPYQALRDDPVIGPPAFAAMQAGRRAVPAEGQHPAWFAELNTEPPHRAVPRLNCRGDHGG